MAGQSGAAVRAGVGLAVFSFLRASGSRMETLWRIELLGGLRVVQGDQVVTRFRYRKTGALLAYLAYYSSRAHPREELIELLWPECDLQDGRNRLRVALSSLRRQLEAPGGPAGLILGVGHAVVRLNPAAVAIDVAALEAALQAAGSTSGGQERIERLTEAVQLYRGELLPGYHEPWVVPERQRLAGAFQHALAQLIAALEQEGDPQQALAWAWRAVAADPLREESHHQLIRLLAAAAQPEAALQQYESWQRLLQQQAGIEPAPEIQLLAQAIRERHPGGSGHLGRESRSVLPAARSAAPSAPPRPALPHLIAASAPRGSLPLALTRFFGREEELAHLCELLGVLTTETYTHKTRGSRTRRAEREDGEEQREREAESSLSSPPCPPCLP